MAIGTNLHNFIISSQRLQTDISGKDDLVDIMQIFKQLNFPLTKTDLNITSAESVQLLSCIWLFETPWTAACQASLSFTNL